MGRPKCFERDTALERAAACFAMRGYEATSIDDLVQDTGVGRQSLYNEFGDKHAIYVAALTRYAETQSAECLRIVEAATHVRMAIAELLAATVSAATCERDKGCILTGAAVEMANQDPDVRKLVVRTTDALVNALEKRLRAARASGEIAEHHSPEALARFFAAQLVAIRVSAQTVGDRKVLEGIARVALGVLG